MREKWNTASICVISESMLPKEIGRVLNLKETQSYKKGDPINRRKVNGPVRSKSIWILESNIDQSVSLDLHIESLIQIIESKIDSFKEILPNCKIEISCGFSSSIGQGGFEINSGLLKRLTTIPINLALDLYPPEE